MPYPKHNTYTPQTTRLRGGATPAGKLIQPASNLIVESTEPHRSAIYEPEAVEELPVQEVLHNQREEESSSLSINDKKSELIVKALEKHRGNRKMAAAELGISERTLYRKIKDLGL